MCVDAIYDEQRLRMHTLTLAPEASMRSLLFSMMVFPFLDVCLTQQVSSLQVGLSEAGEEVETGVEEALV